MNFRYLLRHNQYCNLPKTIYILALGRMITCIGAFVNPLLTLILTQKIGLSLTQAGIYATTAAILQLPCIIMGGKLVDTIGPKKVIMIFQSSAAVMFIFCGLIKPSYTMIILLVTQSCFNSLTSACYDAMVGGITTLENRKASFALVYMGLNLGFAIGPALGGLLFTNHLSLLFIGDGITTLLSVSLIALFVKSSEYAKNNPKLDKNMPEAKKSTLSIIAQRPILIWFALSMLLLKFVYSQFTFTLPMQLNELLGGAEGAIFYGLLGSLNGFVVISCTPIVTALTQNMKPTNVMTVGGLFFTALTLCAFSSSKLQFICIIILVTLGEITITINSATFISTLAPASHRGRIIALLPLIISFGQSMSPSIMGMVITTMGMQSAWLVVGCIGVVGILLMYTLKYRKSEF